MTERALYSDLTAVAGSLWDSNAEERRSAALAAVAFPDSVPLLVARLRVEKDSRVFGALESALVAIGSEAVVMGVLPLLRAPEPAVRIVGTDILRVLGRRSEPVVRALLTDEDPALRMIGITIASNLPNPDVARWLADVLVRDHDADVCRTALEALTGMTTPALVPTLRALYTRFPDRSDLRDAIDFLLSLLDVSGSQSSGDCVWS